LDARESGPALHTLTASAAELSGLRDKYVRMRELRSAHARAKCDPTFEEPDPRPAMARLAAAFPGALRELDALAFEEIERRIVETDAAIATGRPLRWMIAQLAFHRLCRGALATKRWLSGGTAPTREAFLGAGLGEEAELFVDALDAIASPPRGRLLDLVHSRVADGLSVSVGEARRLVLDPDPR
jgi:hypothetical protein